MLAAGTEGMLATDLPSYLLVQAVLAASVGSEVLEASVVLVASAVLAVLEV